MRERGKKTEGGRVGELRDVLRRRGGVLLGKKKREVRGRKRGQRG